MRRGEQNLGHSDTGLGAHPWQAPTQLTDFLLLEIRRRWRSVTMEDRESQTTGFATDSQSPLLRVRLGLMKVCVDFGAVGVGNE